MHKIWEGVTYGAVVVPVDPSRDPSGLFAEAIDLFPGLEVIYRREVKYHRLKIGNPLYITRGVIEDQTPFNAILAAQGSKPTSPDIVLFPVIQDGFLADRMHAIELGMEKMKDQWWFDPHGGDIRFPSLLESTYYHDIRAEKEAFDRILGGNPRYTWIGDGYGHLSQGK